MKRERRINLSTLKSECSIWKAQWQEPIMIQSRWHRKKRINKKWYKRYGMKFDYIDVEVDLISVTRIKDLPLKHELGYETNVTVGTSLVVYEDGFSFEYSNPVSKLKPHQKLKNIKIEMLKEL